MQAFWAFVSRTGTPLVEAIPGERDFSLVTFLWRGDDHTRNVVICDGVAGFDAKDQMIYLRGTDVWRKTYRVRNDARFAYKLSPNDSLQSFDDLKGEEQMQTRLAMLQVDPLNPVIGVILVEATRRHKRRMAQQAGECLAEASVTFLSGGRANGGLPNPD